MLQTPNAQEIRCPRVGLFPQPACIAHLPGVTKTHPLSNLDSTPIASNPSQIWPYTLALIAAALCHLAQALSALFPSAPLPQLQGPARTGKPGPACLCAPHPRAQLPWLRPSPIAQRLATKVQVRCLGAGPSLQQAATTARLRRGQRTMVDQQVSLLIGADECVATGLSGRVK